MRSHRPSQVLLALTAGLMACSEPSASEQTPPVEEEQNPIAQGPGDIRLDPQTRFQTIVGWEAHAQSGQDHVGFRNFRDQLFDLAVNDLGITRIRVEPRANIEHTRDVEREYRQGEIDYAAYRCLWFAAVNDNNDPFDINWNGFKFTGLDAFVDNIILPLRQRLTARGEKFFLTATYAAFVRTACPASPFAHAESAEEYAEFVLAVHIHMRDKYGFVPDAWEVILEPDVGGAAGLWNGARIGRAVVAAGKRLEQHGFEAKKFVAPSTASMSRAHQYFDAMIAIPGVTDYLSEFAFHRYHGVSDANLAGIASRASQHGLKTSMLEHIGSGYEDLHKDLTIGNVSAWQQFALAYFPPRDDGAQYFIIEGSGAGATVRLSSTARYLRQYFRYIRPGAVRFAANTSRPDLAPIAFTHPTNGTVVVVNTEGAATFTIEGLPAGRYGQTFTTGSDTHVAGPDRTLAAGELFAATIPGKGAITIFRK